MNENFIFKLECLKSFLILLSHDGQQAKIISAFAKKINRVYYFRSLLTQLLLIAYFDWTWSLGSFFVECVVSEFCKDEFAESQLHQQQQQQQVRHRGALQCRRLRSPIPEYGTLSIEASSEVSSSAGCFGDFFGWYFIVWNFTVSEPVSLEKIWSMCILGSRNRLVY